MDAYASIPVEVRDLSEFRKINWGSMNPSDSGERIRALHALEEAYGDLVYTVETLHQLRMLCDKEIVFAEQSDHESINRLRNSASVAIPIALDLEHTIAEVLMGRDGVAVRQFHS